VATRVAYMDRWAAGDERRPAAGRNRGLRLWRKAKIVMSRQRRGLRVRTDGRAGTSNPTAERRAGLYPIIGLTNVVNARNIIVGDMLRKNWNNETLL